ncbi:MAG: FecR domain-containing protein [Balneolales bacterium]
MKTDWEKWEWVQRYVTGNAGPEESRKIKRWLDQNPDMKVLVQQVREIQSVKPNEEFEVDAQSSWKQFQEVYFKEEPKPVKYNSLRFSKSIKLQYAYKIAAVLLAALFTGLLVQNYMLGDQTGPDVPEMRELVTEQGEKSQVIFSDGSEVTLNSASAIRFPEKFDGPAREVHLDGEAYFNVKHDSLRPFIVYAQGLEVKVLGTSFNVQGWSEDPAVDVAVRDGKVSVSLTDQESGEQSGVILNKGYSTNVKKGQVPEQVRKIDVNNHLLWTVGGLHFENDKLSDVIKQVERRFNADINVAVDDVLDVPLTATFKYAELEEVLSVIADAMDIEYRQVGSEVEFY